MGNPRYATAGGGGEWVPFWQQRCQSDNSIDPASVHARCRLFGDTSLTPPAFRAHVTHHPLSKTHTFDCDLDRPDYSPCERLDAAAHVCLLPDP